MNEQRFTWKTFFVRSFFVVVATGVLYVLLVSKGPLAEASEVTVYAYSDMLSTEVFDDFTAQTGIQVKVKHFEEIEEVLTKLSLGNEGIDLIAPTDAMVEVLRQKQLLQPLDKGLLPSYGDTDQRLLGHFYDPENEYSVPFAWSPVGICYDSQVVTTPAHKIGWDLVFGTLSHGEVLPPAVRYGDGVDSVCLGEDPWESLYLAAIYLYGTIENLTDVQLRTCAQLLRVQKKGWLECYTNNLKYFLIAGVASAVVAPAAYMNKMSELCPWIKFVVPKKGSLVFIGNLAIPRTVERCGVVHQVIDYLLSVPGGLACFAEHAYNPSNQNTYEQLPASVRRHSHLLPNDRIFKKLHVEHNQLPLERVEQLWQQIKR